MSLTRNKTREHDFRLENILGNVINDDAEAIQIRYFPNSPELVMNDRGDWCDLYVYEDMTLKAGEFACVPLGVAMKLPDGYEAIIAPRSSTFKRTGLIQTNSIGVIDNSYSGNDDQWMMPVYATRDVIIEKGMRLCQFRIQKRQPELVFNAVASLSDSNRGGFGTSGA